MKVLENKNDDSSDERIVGQKLHQGFRLLTKPNPKEERVVMKGHRNNFADAVQRKYSVAATLLPYITSRDQDWLTEKMKKKSKKNL
ncbi:hypothetical protein D8O01_02915 [Acinetobacter baumannii]|nr:hypothetical protein [Acinetobacter baumannii]RKO60396.1 hypothetical protein D8O01_02915 [Acinetobacter baumannii]